MKFHFALFCCLAAILTIAASGTVVTGLTVDADGQPLPGVSASLSPLNDSLKPQFTSSDEAGAFRFDNVAPGSYTLTLSSIGMDSVARDISVNDSTVNDLGKITLTENSVTLQETVVTGIRAAVVAKQDTLEFNAGSFHTNPNASVEDLLKKLPGVQVSSDGSITSGGKTVSKILVDGKEFFADDPKMATKNLPSDIVDKVQVVDRKSETARLTGVDDGEDETVINLTVKKNMNNGWFGTVGAGYGTDNRFQGNLNLNYFRDGNQISLVAGGNNINEMGFSDMGRGRFRDFGGNNGINTSAQAGLNFNVGNGDKFRVGGNVMYSYSNRDARSRFDTQYLFPDSVSYLRGGSKTRDLAHAIRGMFRMQWNISEADMLDFRPEFSLNLRKSELADSSSLYASENLADRVNRNSSLRGNRGSDISTSGRLIYTHKFLNRPGRSISAQVNYSYSNTRQRSTSWNDIEYFLRKDDDELLYQFIDSRQWSNSIEGRLTWTEPLGNPARKNYLEIALRSSWKFNNSDRLTYDLPPLDSDPLLYGLNIFSSTPDGAVFSDSLSNRFRNSFSTHELQIGYKKVADKYNLNVGLTFSPSSSTSRDLINSARNIDTRWVFNVAPYLRFRYKFSQSSSLMAHYRARTSQPSLTQLQPVADYSDPLNITIGNPDLKPSFTQNLGFHFNRYNTDSQQSIFAVANAGFTLNSIVRRTIADPQTGVRTTSYTNAGGDWNVFGMLMINQPFTNRKWRFNARLNGQYVSSPGYIDGQYNRSGNFTLAPTAGITFSSDIFQISVSPEYSFQMATNTMQQQNNRYTHSYGFNADASLYLPFGLELSTDIDFSKTSGYSSGFDNTQWLWNAQISYSFLRDKSLTLSVRAYDILGQKKNVTRSVSAAMITDNEYNDLSRYIMVGITWKFNTLSKKSNKNIDANPGDFPRDGRPMPPPSGEGSRHPGPPPGGF